MRTRHWEWWAVGCAMALGPLGAWLLIHYLVGRHANVRVEATRDLLYFALSVSSTALLALLKATDHDRPPLLLVSTLVIAIGSALTYGAFLIGEALYAVSDLRNAYTCTVVLATAALICGAATEGHTHKGGSKK